MKKAILILSSVLISLGATQAKDVFKKYGFKKEILTLSKGKYQEVFKNDEVVQIGTVLLNTKKNKVVKLLQEDTTKTSYKSEFSSRFLTIDPLAEKYYNISPYAFCANNPIKFVDPNGMDIYRYDDKSGDLVLYKKTDDKTDQIGQFKYNKKSGEYDLKTNKKGEAKTEIDNIEKGILHDGVNFKKNDNVINAGGEGNPSVAGFENFVTQFSDMIDKEIGGYYLTPKGKDDISQIYVSKYENNSDKEAFHGFNLYKTRPDLYGNVDVNTDFHTHLYKFDEADRTRPSGLYTGGGGDMKSKKNQIQNGVKRFIILTRGFSPIEY